MANFDSKMLINVVNHNATCLDRHMKKTGKGFKYCGELLFRYGKKIEKLRKKCNILTLVLGVGIVFQVFNELEQTKIISELEQKVAANFEEIENLSSLLENRTDEKL